eukprot:scpid60447/ scgid13779/ Nuclear factor of activated T-cells 5; Rel domain-containing transcription factor NFAT5; T-cell transcription factor NFAT5
MAKGKAAMKGSGRASHTQTASPHAVTMKQRIGKSYVERLRGDFERTSAAITAQGAQAVAAVEMARAVEKFRSDAVRSLLSSDQHWCMECVNGEPVEPTPFTNELDALMTTISGMPLEFNGIRTAIPRLVMVHEPEEMVRSRYKSEGCRAPIKGREHGTFPSVMIENYQGPVTVVASLETVEADIHPNILIQSTANEDASREIWMPNLIQSVAMKCSDEMVATFDNLAIRRLNKELVGKLRLSRKSTFTKASANDDGVIVYRAYLPHCTVPFSEVKSRRFACVVPAEPAVIDLVNPKIGGAAGGDTVVLVGRKFKSGFTVTVTDGDWSEQAVVDKATSNQNSAVINMPAYKDKRISKRVQVEVYVTTGPAKERLQSDSMTYTYAPEAERNAMGQAAQLPEQKQKLEYVNTMPDTPQDSPSIVSSDDSSPVSSFCDALSSPASNLSLLTPTVTSAETTTMTASDFKPTSLDLDLAAPCGNLLDSLLMSFAPPTPTSSIPTFATTTTSAESSYLNKLIDMTLCQQQPGLLPSAQLGSSQSMASSVSSTSQLPALSLPTSSVFSNAAVSSQLFPEFNPTPTTQLKHLTTLPKAQPVSSTGDSVWSAIQVMVKKLCERHPNDQNCKGLGFMAEKRDPELLEVYRKALYACTVLQTHTVEERFESMLLQAMVDARRIQTSSPVKSF